MSNTKLSEIGKYFDSMQKQLKELKARVAALEGKPKRKKKKPEPTPEEDEE